MRLRRDIEKRYVLADDFPSDAVLESLESWVRDGCGWGLGPAYNHRSCAVDTAKFNSFVDFPWSEAFTAFPGPLYRGLRFHTEDDGDILYDLTKGKKLAKRKVKAESWGTNLAGPRALSGGEPYDDADGLFQLVFKYKPKPSDIVLNLNAVWKHPRMKGFIKEDTLPSEVLLRPVELDISMLYEYRLTYHGDPKSLPFKVPGVVINKWARWTK